MNFYFTLLTFLGVGLLDGSSLDSSFHIVPRCLSLIAFQHFTQLTAEIHLNFFFLNKFATIQVNARDWSLDPLTFQLRTRDFKL